MSYLQNVNYLIFRDGRKMGGKNYKWLYFQSEPQQHRMHQYSDYFSFILDFNFHNKKIKSKMSISQITHFRTGLFNFNAEKAKKWGKSWSTCESKIEWLKKNNIEFRYTIFQFNKNVINSIKYASTTGKLPSSIGKRKIITKIDENNHQTHYLPN